MSVSLTHHVEGFTLCSAIAMGEPTICSVDIYTIFTWNNGAQIKLIPNKGINSLTFPADKPGYIIVTRDSDLWVVGIASKYSSSIHTDVLCIT